MLCPVDYPYAPDRYTQKRCLSHKTRVASSRWRNRLDLAAGILRDQWKLRRAVADGGFRHVLFSSYTEYLAPIWAPRLREYARQGVTFAAVVHDPVRDYVVGPAWWHRISVRDGYSFLKEAFVHEEVDLEGLPTDMSLPTTVIPHGPFACVPPSLPAEKVRAQLGLPPGSKVMIAFGYIRDSKNLDLVIRAMADFPDIHLLVAGRVSTEGQKPLPYYKDLAGTVGVAERCRWIDRFIEKDEVGNLFEASDLVLMTYSRSFRSASGVLNTAAAYQKPCLASAGQGSLATAVKKYTLGIWIEPDDPAAVKAGIARWLQQPPTPDWDGYNRDHSWKRNAEIVASRLRTHNP
jgi:glycosyltransferase involved in cell wall biosynthesis